MTAPAVGIDRDTAVAAAPRRESRRAVVAVIVALGCLGAAIALSLSVGNKAVSIPDILAVLQGGGDPYLATVLESRVPRTVIGVVAGIALAVSGTLLQTVTRNPLADPGLLGVNTGAALGIVLGTLVWGSAAADSLLLALPGALVAGVAVLGLGGGARGGAVRLVLAGAVLSAVLSAVIQAITIRHPDVFDSYRFWVVGSLSGRSIEIAGQLAPAVALGTVAAFVLSRGLAVMALGPDVATALGVNTGRVRVLSLLVATVLGAAATAAAGPLAFVGLAVPHLARAVVGSSVRSQLALGIVLGPVMLLLSDVIGRVVARPEELMVGVVTALVGAPFLLVAVRRLGRSA